jgi:FMN reductase
MSREVLFLAGSPSITSRSALVADAVAEEIERAGLRKVPWSLADFEPADVFYGRTESPAVARFLDAVKGASALVLSTPVYKATYTGALKAIVDLVPPDALLGRPLLGVATARLPAHGAEVDGAFRALSAFFKARAIQSLVVLDDELQNGPGGKTLSPEAAQRAHKAARALVAALDEARAVSRP